MLFANFVHVDTRGIASKLVNLHERALFNLHELASFNLQTILVRFIQTKASFNLHKDLRLK